MHSDVDGQRQLLPSDVRSVFVPALYIQYNFRPGISGATHSGAIPSSRITFHDLYGYEAPRKLHVFRAESVWGMHRSLDDLRGVL